MKFILNTPNSPGTQFNEHTEQCIVKLYEYLGNKGLNWSMAYGSFIKQVDFTTSSYMRNICPFLKNADMLNDYTTVSRKMFTGFGRVYYHVIHALNVSKQEVAAPANATQRLDDLKKNIVRCAIANIVMKKNVPYGLIFKLTLEHLDLWSRINEKEFALIVYLAAGGVTKEQYEDVMTNDRNNIDFSVAVKEKGSPSIKYERKLTCYSYFIGSLRTAGVIGESNTNGFCERICDPSTLRRMYHV